MGGKIFVVNSVKTNLPRFVLSPLSELQRTELLVLGLVGWELAAPTSLDFLPLVAASWPAAAAPAAASCRGRAETFLVLAATEAQYSHLRPSTLVSSTTVNIIYYAHVNINLGISQLPLPIESSLGETQ